MDKHEIKPFLKWAGGKRQLLHEIKDNYPHQLYNQDINTYVEPFLGGGAVLFDILNNFNVERIIVNDINRDLIFTYQVIRDNPNELIALLEKYELQYLPLNEDQRKEYFYTNRELYNKLKIELKDTYTIDDKNIVLMASLFIFLNRTCFNGLYRLNKKGEFNVPIGKYKNPRICDSVNLTRISDAIQDVTFLNKNYNDLSLNFIEKTFVYIDPPYRALPNTASFTSYFNSDFGEKEQILLSSWITGISSENTFVMVSNSDPHNTNESDNFFYENYLNLSPFCNIQKVLAKRNINSNASKRMGITELLIKNYR